MTLWQCPRPSELPKITSQQSLEQTNKCMSNYLWIFSVKKLGWSRNDRSNQKILLKWMRVSLFFFDIFISLRFSQSNSSDLLASFSDEKFSIFLIIFHFKGLILWYIYKELFISTFHFIQFIVSSFKHLRKMSKSD